MPNRLGAFKDSKYGVIGVVDFAFAGWANP